MRTKNQWTPGERATFTYSLAEDLTSKISARLAHRSGEVVIVLSEEDHDRSREALPSIEERAEAGALVVYRVRFPDGHEDDAFEDELTEVES